MSVQENYLKSIADAIREKDGSTDPIPANTFAARIRAIKAEIQDSAFLVPLTVSVSTGAEVTAEKGDILLSSVSDDGGTASFVLKSPGIWTITASLDGKEKSVSVQVPDGIQIEFNLNSRLPEGYTEVEHIKSSGTQYIDTKIIPDHNTRVVLQFQFISASGTFYSIFGVEGKSGYNGFMLFANKSTNNVQGIYGDQYFSHPNSLFVPGVDNTVDFGKGQITFNGAALELLKQNFTCTGSMCIFCSKNYTGGIQYLNSMLLRSFQVWKNDILVGDFVPCRREDGAVGLYDLVTKAFFENAGTGVFEAGPVTEVIL